MLLKKSLLTISGIVLISVSALWAGDSANFVDMGFSGDGRIYMFGQYGVLLPSLRPWAELFIVDVTRNEFVSGGRVSYTHDRPIQAGQDGSGALFRLLAENANLVSNHGISLPNQGQPLFISLEPNPPLTGETIEFRDFISGKFYRARLVPTIEGSGQNVTSSFFIDVEVHFPNGRVERQTLGNPHIRRPLIFAYNFRQVLVNNQRNAVVFVIEMKRRTPTGHDVRYMVETLRL